MSDLVTVKTFMQRYEAEMAKGLLADEEIESIIFADDCGGCYPGFTFGMVGVKLLVKKENIKKAQEILKIVEKEQFR